MLGRAGPARLAACHCLAPIAPSHRTTNQHTRRPAFAAHLFRSERCHSKGPRSSNTRPQWALVARSMGLTAASPQQPRCCRQASTPAALQARLPPQAVAYRPGAAGCSSQNATAPARARRGWRTLELRPGGGGGSAARRCTRAAAQAIAVPGPLFISEGFDRNRLRDSKTQQLQPSGNFLQFPMREESDLRRTPPLVRCVPAPPPPPPCRALLASLLRWRLVWWREMPQGFSHCVQRCRDAAQRCRRHAAARLPRRSGVLACSAPPARRACGSRAQHPAPGNTRVPTTEPSSSSRGRRGAAAGARVRWCALPSNAPHVASRFRSLPLLCRVRLAVEYRVHSRQMICVGGSQIPFGWSFLSIAKVRSRGGSFSARTCVCVCVCVCVHGCAGALLQGWQLCVRGCAGVVQATGAGACCSCSCLPARAGIPRLTRPPACRCLMESWRPLDSPSALNHLVECPADSVCFASTPPPAHPTPRRCRPPGTRATSGRWRWSCRRAPRSSTSTSSWRSKIGRSRCAGVLLVWSGSRGGRTHGWHPGGQSRAGRTRCNAGPPMVGWQPARQAADRAIERWHAGRRRRPACPAAAAAAGARRHSRRSASGHARHTSRASCVASSHPCVPPATHTHDFCRSTSCRRAKWSTRTA